MNWVTVIWPMGSGACLTLALLHIVVWWRDRAARANLVFSVMAIAVAAFAALELALMRAETPEQFGMAVRWMHVPAWVIIASLVVFVRLYLRAGRQWLAWTVVGVRTVSLILNFVFAPNINYREITALRRIPFLGQSVSVAEGVPNPWMLVAQLSLLLLVIFVTDAAIAVWRRGDRRQALMVGGSIVLFVVVATAQAVAITWGIISMPMTVSLFYQGLVAAMAYELSYGVLRAAALARRLQASDAQLRESEARFRIVADSAPVLIWMSGLDKLCTFLNRPWLEFTGRTIEQEIGNGWTEGVHPDDLQRCLNIYTNAFDTREPFVMQYRLRRHDREYRWISNNGVPRYDAQKNFAGYIGSCLDVTELVNKEQALRDSEERMSLATDAAGLVVWTWDIRRDEVSLADKDRAFFGFSQREKLNGDRFRSVVHSEDRQLVRQLVEKSLHTSEELEAEYRIVLPDDKVRWVTRRSRVEFDANGEPTCQRGVLMDITARKVAEAEAAQHREELGHFGRVAVMGEMAASVAHELNQPLSGIISNASAGQRFIDRGDVDLGELRDLLADIVADGRRAGDVIRGVRSMVKKGASMRQRVNLNDLVMNVVRMVNPDATLHSCKMETLLEPNLPAVEADPIQLQQVLINLVMNAFDAMRDTPLGRRKIAIATERNGQSTIRASVRDYGVGISEEVRDRVFEHFFTTKTEGLGMGLGIVRSIVESHAGTVTAENVAGGGARFHITLPVNAAPL